MPLDNQGPTYRCGPYAAREWFEAYGHPVVDTQVWADAIALADSQKGISFSQEHDVIANYATATGAIMQWLGDGYLRDFATFDQAVRDGWCVVVGVLESDLHPGQNYEHYLAVDGLSGDSFSVKDSLHAYDGETGHPTVEEVHAGIRDSWDAAIAGLAWQFI